MSATKDNNRSEDFKRATASALRAIAEEPDVQVAFQPGPTSLAGKRARLPLPTRSLLPAEMARLRGAADSLAQMQLHSDAGLGFRMLIPQTSAQLVKFDFAVPFDGANRGKVRFLAGFGSEF